MDQHVLAWLNLQETGRHNSAQEAETARHNKAVEKEERNWHLMQSISQAGARITSLLQTQMQTQATKYASDNSRRATEFAARTSAEASRYNTQMRMWETLQQVAATRQHNVIQDRYNRGQLVVAAAQIHETKRSNLAREKETTLSRLTNATLKDRELTNKEAQLSYQREKDWLDRAKSQREFETNMRLQMSGQLVNLLGVGAKAKMWQAFNPSSSQSKGGTNYGENTKEAQQTSVFERMDQELKRQGR